MYETLMEARREAAQRAENQGESFCIVSGRKNGKKLFRIYAMRGFGLPPGGILEEVVDPVLKRFEIEPQEKTSSNGF